MWHQVLSFSLVSAVALGMTINFAGLVVLYVRQVRLERELMRHGKPSVAERMTPPTECRTRKPVVSPVPEVTDHGLAGALIRELFRLKNKYRNDQLTTESIAAAVGRLEDELRSRGYSARDMTDEPWNEGMRVAVSNFIPTAGVMLGNEKVVRTIRPEISYKNRIIEPGTVEVAVAE